MTSRPMAAMNAALKKIFVPLLLLYLLALHTSMAGMELFAWTITACSLAYQSFFRRDFSIFKSNRAVNLWILAMTLAIAAGLLVNPLYRPFSFQLGFMRWAIVMWGVVFALQEVWDQKFEKTLLSFWLVFVAITGLYASVQCLYGIDFIRTGAIEQQFGTVYRATGWFSAILTFAYSFGVSLFALSLPAYRDRGRWVSIVFVFGALGIIGSMARGAWLASIITVVLYLLFNWRVMVLPTILGVYALSKALVWYAVGFGAKVQGMENMQIDHSSSVRIDLWRSYWQLFLDHPWFGVGIKQGDKFLPATYEKLGIHQEFASHAHNNFLQFLGGGGIFGFIAYCGLNFVFLRKAWRLRKVSPWGWSILLAQIFLQIGGLTECNFIDGEVTHMLVFTWAILLVVESQMKERPASTGALNPI